MIIRDVDTAPRTRQALQAATENTGAKGVIAGAATAAGSLMLASSIGLAAVTPAGLVVVTVIGGVAGGLGVLKWVREQLS